MRVDPEAVYLELSDGSTVYNFTTGDMRVAPAVILHWKDGRKWHRRSVIAQDGESLGDCLRALATWFDTDGLSDALAKAAA